MTNKKLWYKVLAIVLVVCMLSVVLIACDGDKGNKPAAKVTVMDKIVSGLQKSVADGDMTALKLGANLDLSVKNGEETTKYGIYFDLCLKLLEEEKNNNVADGQANSTYLWGEITKDDALALGIYYNDNNQKLNDGTSAFNSNKLYLQSSNTKIAIPVPYINGTMNALDADVYFDDIDLQDEDVWDTVLNTLTMIEDLGLFTNAKASATSASVDLSLAQILDPESAIGATIASVGGSINDYIEALGIDLALSDLITVLPMLTITLSADFSSTGALTNLGLSINIPNKDIVIDDVDDTDNENFLVVGMTNNMVVSAKLGYTLNQTINTSKYHKGNNSTYATVMPLLNAQLALGLKLTEAIAIDFTDTIGLNVPAGEYKASLAIRMDPTKILTNLYTYTACDAETEYPLVRSTEYKADRTYFNKDGSAATGITDQTDFTVTEVYQYDGSLCTATAENAAKGLYTMVNVSKADFEANKTDYYQRVSSLNFSDMGSIVNSIVTLLGSVEYFDLSLIQVKDAGGVALTTPVTAVKLALIDGAYADEVLSDDEMNEKSIGNTGLYANIVVGILSGLDSITTGGNWMALGTTESGLLSTIMGLVGGLVGEDEEVAYDKTMATLEAVGEYLANAYIGINDKAAETAGKGKDGLYIELDEVSFGIDEYFAVKTNDEAAFNAGKYYIEKYSEAAEFVGGTTYYTYKDSAYTEATGLTEFANETTYYTKEMVTTAAYSATATYYTLVDGVYTATAATSSNYDNGTYYVQLKAPKYYAASGYVEGTKYFTKSGDVYTVTTEVNADTDFEEEEYYIIDVAGMYCKVNTAATYDSEATYYTFGATITAEGTISLDATGLKIHGQVKGMSCWGLPNDISADIYTISGSLFSVTNTFVHDVLFPAVA